MGRIVPSNLFRGFALLVVLGLVLWPAPSEADPTIEGAWSDPIDAPNIVHAAQLATGEVLGFAHPTAGSNPPFVVDLATMTLEFVPVDVVNGSIFCSGQSFLADGRLLVTGGHLQAPEQAAGLRTVFTFDPFSRQWTSEGEMAVGRWYPTNVTLGDGRVLVFAGHDEQGNTTPLVERYDPFLGMQVLPGADMPLPTYPRMHLLPSGEVFAAGPQALTGTFDPVTRTWRAVDMSNYGGRGAGTSVLLPLRPPDFRPRVLIMGGSNPATNTAEIIDLSEPEPVWRYTAPMNYPRRDLNAVLLPDGTVFVVGGEVEEDGTAVLQAEVFDPETETWTPVATMQRPRLYHSTAMLLPDGRVAAAGGEGGGAGSAEFYSPPYLFQGPRPQITSAPAVISYGETFEVVTPDAQDVAQVVLMRPGAVTHSVNMDQRLIELEFQADAGALTVQMPANRNLAPPGYYMLFILNADGIPSVAAFTQLTFGGSTCPWDVDGNGTVALTDVLAVLAAFGVTPPPPRVDVDANGAVTLTDVLEVVTHFGMQCRAGAPP